LSDAAPPAGSSGRALVTGATGFLGAALAARLRTLGFEVTGLGRDHARGQALAAAGVRFVACDLGDAAALTAACAGHDYVFHSGALSSPWGRWDDFYRANVTGTRHVVAASRAAGVRRLIHVSTPSLYIDHRDRLAIREDEPLPSRPINHYAATKRLAEAVIDEAHAAGLPVITIRPQGIFGPGDRTLFPRILRVARRGRLPLIGDGRNVIDVTYVDNVVDALVACATSPPATLGHKYNISNGEPVGNYDMIERVLAAVGVHCRQVRVPFAVAWAAAGLLEAVHRLGRLEREPPLTRYSVLVLARSRTLDISAARGALGYHPRIGLDEGIQRFARWWKENDRVSG
jgi:nucleoside-diphosphate-sugar epimerase